MSTAARLSRRRTWLRVLVLLLALLVPGGPAEASAVASVVAGETVEYDAVDTAVRPIPGDRRAASPLRPAPLRPAPRPAPAPCAPAARPCPAPPWTPYAPHTLRTVVLRC